MSKVSPFLDPGPAPTPGVLAIVHLSRDNIQPVYLQGKSGAVDGYAEGAVINTRFGSFPHSTILDKPWGSQVRASIVDTGSRGRKKKVEASAESGGLANDTEENTPAPQQTKNIKTAASGFVHILPPTPELWTTSLPHRTQVVYTPDYSYILHRIRARPGMNIIEAGAGSGSFTHAAVRAVFNGYPKSTEDTRGKVWSFEFNEDRYHKMQTEIKDHLLDDLVHITHRDVYNNGFLVDGKSPEADCVFLDLPAPWKAIPHLSRRKPSSSQLTSGGLEPFQTEDSEWKSPLRADRSVYLCTFSPCIEQVTKTVEIMRRMGWMDIEMVEVAHRRINAMREKIGLNLPAEHGTQQSAQNVDEALARLREVEEKNANYNYGRSKNNATANNGDEEMKDAQEPANGIAEVKAVNAGRLITRTEAELKTHTSYLVFAVLPQEWSDEQEAAALEKWPCGKELRVIGSLDKAARKQQKREMLQGTRSKRKRGAGSDSGSKDEASSKKIKTS
ncbi:tRNA methyltransferase complex GCD14 subunit [Xylariomycetidae sp. FL0641]|nr:tRNA methyltransferase complex GCD14 subunit [Xylariomycetidae sp. FL0641]